MTRRCFHIRYIKPSLLSALHWPFNKLVRFLHYLRDFFSRYLQVLPRFPTWENYESRVDNNQFVRDFFDTYDSDSLDESEEEIVDLLFESNIVEDTNITDLYRGWTGTKINQMIRDEERMRRVTKELEDSPPPEITSTSTIMNNTNQTNHTNDHDFYLIDAETEGIDLINEPEGGLKLWEKRRKLWTTIKSDLNYDEEILRINNRKQQNSLLNISNKHYSLIYENLIIKEKKLKNGINLETAIFIIKEGWIDRGQWPPKK